jgi:hypothetical protein
MTLDLLQAIDELVPPAPRPGDWEDVLARAAVSRGIQPSVEAMPSPGPRVSAVSRLRRRTSRKRVALLLVAAVVLAIIAAPALGLAPPFLDFFSSKHASKRAVHSFALLNVTAPRGMSPKVISGEARLVTTYHLRDGTPFPLVVAPTRKHGICFTFGFGGGCASSHDLQHDQSGDRNAGEIGLGRDGSHVLTGYVFDTRIARIEIRFRHAPPASVPLLWVSPPINAGFFFYDVPRKLRRPGSGPVAVVALDARGHELARNASMFRPLPVWFNPAAVSDRSKRHTILRSGRLSIVIAPSRTGGNCFWLKLDVYQVMGGGCAPPRYLTRPMAGGLNHGMGVTGFSAQVQPAVSRVELNFEDGANVTLQPVQGHVLYDIPAVHWPRGHRLRTAVAYTSNDKAVARQSFDTKDMGVYDCAKPIPIGAGETACP